MRTVGGRGLSAKGVVSAWGCLPRGFVHPLWTEFLTHAYENITYLQLSLRMVNVVLSAIIKSDQSIRKVLVWYYSELSRYICRLLQKSMN